MVSDKHNSEHCGIKMSDPGCRPPGGSQGNKAGAGSSCPVPGEKTHTLTHTHTHIHRHTEAHAIHRDTKTRPHTLTGT